jgi:hypothetical protein
MADDAMFAPLTPDDRPAQARISTSDKIAKAWLACRRASISDVGNSDCRLTRRSTSEASEKRS